MSLSELIENAETKDELEKIGQKKLGGVDVDKRKGLETIRVDLLSIAEDQAQLDAVQDEKSPQEDAKSPEGAEAETESAGTSQEDTPASKIAGPQQTADQSPDEAAPAKKNRLLRHRGNGRVFTYSAALAAKRGMEEV